MRVRFTGADGSMGYRRGEVYDVITAEEPGGTRPRVRIISPRPVPYESWDAFWANWSPPSVPPDRLPAPQHLDGRAVARYLEARADAQGAATAYVVLEPRQTAWRSDGGPPYTGPGIVHYWRLRDGTVLSRQVDALTVAAVIDVQG